MPRVHHVEKARKDNPVCKKGESYYHWQLFKQPKQYSLTYPRASQLTGSEFLSAVYQTAENVGDWTTDPKASDEDNLEALKSLVEEARDLYEEWAGECQERFDNMPEGLQQGDTGMLLEGRVGSCEEAESGLADLHGELDSLFEEAEATAAADNEDVDWDDMHQQALDASEYLGE